MDGGGTLTLTSGASGRIIPIFARCIVILRILLHFFIFIQSLILYSLLRRTRTTSAATLSSPRLSDRRRLIGRFGSSLEEEDVRKRRAIAESLEMDGGDWFLIEGKRRNLMFCRKWGIGNGDVRGILVIIHGLNEHSGRYLHFAKQLMSCNFGVYAMDWTGNCSRQA